MVECLETSPSRSTLFLSGFNYFPTWGLSTSSEGYFSAVTVTGILLQLFGGGLHASHSTEIAPQTTPADKMSCELLCSVILCELLFAVCVSSFKIAAFSRNAASM